MKMSSRLVVFTFATFLMCAPVIGQTSAAATGVQDQDGIAEFTSEILTALAKAKGQQIAKVDLLTKEEKEIEDDLKKVTEDKEKAERSLMGARLAIRISQQLPHGGGAKAAGIDDYERYEKAIRREAEAEERLSQLGPQEEADRAKLETVRSAKAAAKQELSQMETAGEQQRDKLKKLYDAWRENNDEANFKALTGQLTLMSAGMNQTTNAEFMSQDSASNKTDGARINYETELDRKNNVEPVKATPCTTVKPPESPTCILESMPKGWYYIWSVRQNGIATSDKNFYTRVAGPRITITVTEHQ